MFHKDGTFVKEFFVEKNTRANGSVWELAPVAGREADLPAQRRRGQQRGPHPEPRHRRDRRRFGRNGRKAGEFHWVHNLAVDSKGNIFTTEVDTGKRAQKFLFRGDMVLRKRTATQ